MPRERLRNQFIPERITRATTLPLLRRLWPRTYGCGLCLRPRTPEATHLEPNAPRTITVSEADTPPVVRAGLLQSTLILFPAEEKVANVFAGDTVDWVFDGGHVASRFISIKPKVANSTTDVHIVSDHGNEYTLQLREVSGDDDPHFDSKVFIVPATRPQRTGWPNCRYSFLPQNWTR